MQEYKDGSYGEIKDATKLKKLFDDPEELAKTKAIHFGTVAELKAMKKAKGAGFKQRIDRRLSSIEQKHQELEVKINEILVKLDLRTDEILGVDKI